MQRLEIRNVLVATDLTAICDDVVRGGAALASLTGAGLHVLHVEVPGPADRDEKPGDAPQAQSAESRLEAQIRRAVPEDLAPIGQMVVRGERVSDEIGRQARELAADVIVLGVQGRPTAEPRLGRTADRVLRSSRVPCLVVGNPIRFPLTRVGVLTDLSPEAAPAVEAGMAWAASLCDRSPSSGGEAAAAIVATIITAGEAEGTGHAEATIRDELESVIDAAAGGVDGSDRVATDAEVLWSDDVASAAVDWARDRGLDLVVLGSHGLSGLPHPYLGGVAAEMARRSPAPVLLVPGEGPAQDRVLDAAGAGSVRRVVTGVDFHDSSLEAVRWMTTFFAPDADHELVHVLDAPDLPAPLRLLLGRAAGSDQSTRDRAARRLEELRRELPETTPGTTHVVEGKASAEILRLASQTGADLIAVGEQGERRGVGALLGSTAERILFGAPVPVLLVRKVGDSPPGRLLVAIDDSAPTDLVLAWTRSLLERFDASVTLLHVVDRLALLDESDQLSEASRLPETEARATADAREWLLSRSEAAGLPVGRVEIAVAAGDPGYEIIARAARGEVDLIILGSERGSVARTPIEGRIVNDVVRSAPCSVLIVPV